MHLPVSNHRFPQEKVSLLLSRELQIRLQHMHRYAVYVQWIYMLCLDMYRTRSVPRAESHAFRHVPQLELSGSCARRVVLCLHGERTPRESGLIQLDSYLGTGLK